MSVTRRTILKASAAATVLGGVGMPFVARAQQADFTYKFADDSRCDNDCPLARLTIHASTSALAVL